MSRRSPSRFDRFGWLGAAIGAAIILGACNSAASPVGSTGTTASQPVPTEASTPTAAASEPESSLPEVTAVPTAIDPCQVVTQSEASALAGTSFGAGEETTTSGNAKICTYGSQTLNVLNVDVALAPDQATIAAGEAEVESQLQQSVSEGLTKTDLTGIGDKAVYLAASQTISGQTVSVAAIYVVKGLTFLAISDVVAGSPAPTLAALQAQATTSLSRLP
ncbi:MAG TPA: hypothetical protein VFW20_11060 [Candidatus Limnocylindrales bacterium]|nr:hypothetical protein [Candidatus Limnocylindrales bacterium]